MEARFHHWIKNKKGNFYLTIVFFLKIASLHLAILTFSLQLWDITMEF